ncbi:response regulator [Pedobacter jamesrossensis]|uniref:Response regulator n=1 Tax=Pedobacter jamesrossensis TaxID=1908238 RepID=A0ABV8NNN7_9SPHI
MPKKIMLCDDEVDILDITTFILEDEGYEIISTSNSLVAEQMFIKELPDLLIIDLWMPGISGDQIIKSLKKRDIFKNIPMIILSASDKAKLTSIACGADAFIAKPYDIDEFLVTISKYIN